MVYASCGQPLLEDGYLRTLSEAAERLSIGRVYDVLLVACAWKSQAEIIYTWDVKHFLADCTRPD
jgi:predicted nucleic acid-binding protein